jgi:pimeloyl-ACP methyl ester carboxylesterase
MLDKKTRLAKAFNLETPDRPPILGGWLAAPGHIQTLTGCSDDDYWSNPFGWGLEAERVLGSDGVITIHEPVSRGEYRIVDGRVLEERARYTVEGVLAEIETMLDPEELESSFDEEQEYKRFVAEFEARQAQCGDLLWCPADWGIVPQALWYGKFGYESALMTLALHPDRYRKLIQVSAVWGYQRAVLLARAMREGIAPRAFLTGEDLCGQRGPMVSPDYLRREYFPLVRRNFEPLLGAGARIIWHCDGDWRPLLDDVFACGIGGLQGFQRECGMDLEWLADLRTWAGDPLIILGPLSVTTTLPHGSPDDVRAEVQRAMQLCRGKASLVFFTSNTINPDVPLENIQAFWQTVQASAW